MRFGPQLLGDLDAGAQREWLLADGRGGYAMGTVAGLRTRRYHALLVVSTGPVGARRVGLAALDPVLVIGDRRVRLAVDEWAGGAVDPRGHELLETFDLTDGVPRWRWSAGEVRLEREIAMARGRSSVTIVHRLLRSREPVRLELAALVTWRDAHGQRGAGDAAGEPSITMTSDGFTVDRAFRVSGPALRPAGSWFRGVRYREEAARGLWDTEDLWHAGTFVVDLAPGQSVGVQAWAPAGEAPPPSAPAVIAAARERARGLARVAGTPERVGRALAHAADQFILADAGVVAGYPWFGEWSRDTMVSYEGLFLASGRHEEGRRLLLRAAASLSEGMLPNTTDPVASDGEAVAYNTADAALWLIHAVGRHVAVTGDLDAAAQLADPLLSVISAYLAGTRYGIAVDATDGLLRQGAPGLALTWMDARVDGQPVTPRGGKAVEVNALWVNALGTAAELLSAIGRDGQPLLARAAATRKAFRATFVHPGGWWDTVAGDPAESARVRPNSLLAVSLPHAPLAVEDPASVAIVARCAGELLTPLGLRSLAPADPAYRGLHRGGPVERDRAYHQGTVWPWLIGAYVDAAGKVGAPTAGLLGALEQHVDEWGLGSVSETADGDPPHRATGCPFQAWSVAELMRAHRLTR